jgi:hypothetical protein
MPRATQRALGGIAVSLVMLAISVACTPLRRSEPQVRDWLEKTTPIGSTRDEVKAIATHRGWYDPGRQGSDGRTSGSYIRGELGEYREFVFVTSVTVFWEFDASSRLTEIRIWKTADSL